MNDQEETILEYVVRQRLNREDLVDLLSSLGGQRQGSRNDLAERLLGIKGLKAKDALSKLTTEDLRVLVRRFDVPEAPKQGGLLGFATSVIGDERSSLIKRADEAASKQRTPVPRSAPPREPTPEPKAATPKRLRTVEAAAEAPKAVPAPPGPLPTQPPEAPHAPPTPPPAGASIGLPAFQETRDFVGSYNFAYQWNEEDYYEAELLGALRGRFGVNNAVRQQGESGRVYDIVVRNSARIEVKLPKQKAELDRMIGQVRRYLSQHPGGVIVVIIGFMMKNQQEIHNSKQELESAGAVVFVK